MMVEADFDQFSAGKISREIMALQKCNCKFVTPLAPYCNYWIDH